MPGLRRAGGEYRPACESRGAQDSRSAAHARSRGDRVSELSERLRGIIRPPGSGVASGFSRTEPDVVPRANPSDLENLLDGRWYGHCFIVERRMAPSAKYGAPRMAIPRESSTQPATARPSPPAARPRVRRFAFS